MKTYALWVHDKPFYTEILDYVSKEGVAISLSPLRQFSHLPFMLDGLYYRIVSQDKTCFLEVPSCHNIFIMWQKSHCSINNVKSWASDFLFKGIT